MSLLRAIDQRMVLAIIPIFKYSNQWQLYRNKYNLGADKVVALPPHDWEVKGSIPASASSPKRAIFISDTHEQQKKTFYGSGIEDSHIFFVPDFAHLSLLSLQAAQLRLNWFMSECADTE